MTKIKDLHRNWMKKPKYKVEYKALGKEFELVRSRRSRQGFRRTMGKAFRQRVLPLCNRDRNDGMDLSRGRKWRLVSARMVGLRNGLPSLLRGIQVVSGQS